MRDQRRVGDGRELGHPDPVRGHVPRARRDLGGQPCLPGTAGTDQGDEPVGGQRGTHSADLVLTPDEAGELGSQVGPPARRRAGRGAGSLNFAAQHLKVDRTHLRARIDAELVGEPGAQRLVRRERVRLPPGGGERAHQQRDELLVQRVLGGERRQLRHARGGPAGVDLLPEDE